MEILIDGYNLIRQVPKLKSQEQKSLQAGRDHLISLLATYKKIKRHKITVVFDGVLNLSEFAPAFQQQGIHVRFSPSGVTADDVIEGIVSQKKQQLIVVSSDNRIIKHAEKNGAATIRSKEFFERLQMASSLGDTKGALEPDKKKPTHKRWQTKKVGPSKKLPKKKRRHSQKLKKL